MRRVREHVDGRATLEVVAELVAEHREVRGERRRVARDVDEPRGLEGAGAAEGFTGEPRAWGVDDHDVRLTGLLPELLERRPTLPAKKRAFSIPFAVAFSIAQATDSSEISTPHTSAASAANDSPIVPVPQ